MVFEQRKKQSNCPSGEPGLQQWRDIWSEHLTRGGEITCRAALVSEMRLLLWEWEQKWKKRVWPHTDRVRTERVSSGSSTAGMGNATGSTAHVFIE